MADIYKVYTAEQLYDMYRLYLLSKNVGITDFNEGSKVRALIESNSEIVSSISMDYKEALMKAIPIALYEGFGFNKLAAVSAIGYIRPLRDPAFWIKYTGAGTSALITSTPLLFSAPAVTGAPGDVFSFNYATYPTLAVLVAAIEALPNWSATLVKSGTLACNSLYQYTSKEVINSKNYLYTNGLDIMLDTADAITIPVGFSISKDNLQILTTASTNLLAGDSGCQCPAQVSQTGTIGNISINAIDTRNAQGSINSNIAGIENVINDSAFSGGSEEETSSQRQVRFSETVTALNAGTKSGIISAIKNIQGIRSVGMRTSYPFKGTNTIIVDDGSGIISAALLAAVEKVLYGDPNDIANYPGKNAEGVGYNIIAPVIVDVDIAVTVSRLSTVNVDSLVIQVDVQTAIEQYINTRQLGEDVLLSEIVRVGKNSNAAAYDLIVTSPVSNIVIDENEFSKTGAGTGGSVTVTMVIV
jgi:uncharacterized phage protein gp47/JayE